MEELSFDYTSGSSFNESNIGGPSFFSSHPTNDLLTSSQKNNAFNLYTSNDGYILLDFKQITNTSRDNEISIVNNTAFFVFFCLFLILLLFIIIFMIAGKISVMLGLYLILIFATIIYLFCVLYRSHTIGNINISTDRVNNIINENKKNFDKSILQLPNHITSLTQSLST